MARHHETSGILLDSGRSAPLSWSLVRSAAEHVSAARAAPETLALAAESAMPRDPDKYDFFVSYARADNREGWISGFVDELVSQQYLGVS